MDILIFECSDFPFLVVTFQVSFLDVSKPLIRLKLCDFMISWISLNAKQWLAATCKSMYLVVKKDSQKDLISIVVKPHSRV